VKFGTYAEATIKNLPIRKKTRANYVSAYFCHIGPKLANKRIKSVTREDIQTLLVGLPVQTAHTVLAVLKTIFREALRDDFVRNSPTFGVKAPTKIVAARKFLLWDELDGHDFGKYNCHIRFLATHGLRWGEAVALTSEDVRNGRVYITKSVHGATKSQSGIRSVPQVCDFIPFPKTPRPLRRVLSPHGVTIHSLRHTYAYFLKTEGVHVTTAQRLLGHSDPRVTMAVYTQVLDTEIDDVGVLLSKAMNKGRGISLGDGGQNIFMTGLTGLS
jgi:integrase